MPPLLPCALVLTLALGLAPVQDASSPADDEDDGFRYLDWIHIVVNTDSITFRRLSRAIDENLTRFEVTTEEENLAVRQKTLQEEVQHLLMRQAGEDLGIDPRVIEGWARDIYRDRVERSGGVGEMLATLRKEDSTSVSQRKEIEGQLYLGQWRKRQLGLGGGPGERPSIDRFIRPGTRRRVWERMRKTGDQIELLEDAGAVPATHELQILLLLPESSGGDLDQALDKAQEIRRLLDEGGVEWEEAIRRLGQWENRGLLGALTREQILQRFDPGDGFLLGFAREAEIGAFSPVLPLRMRNTFTGQAVTRGFAIYMLLSRAPAKVPGFTEPGVQKELDQNLQNELDNERFLRSIAELRASAYIWYPGIEEQREQLEERRAEQERETLEKRAENAKPKNAEKAEGGGDPEQGDG